VTSLFEDIIEPSDLLDIKAGIEDVDEFVEDGLYSFIKKWI